MLERSTNYWDQRTEEIQLSATHRWLDLISSLFWTPSVFTVSGAIIQELIQTASSLNSDAFAVTGINEPALLYTEQRDRANSWNSNVLKSYSWIQRQNLPLIAIRCSALDKDTQAFVCNSALFSFQHHFEQIKLSEVGFMTYAKCYFQHSQKSWSLPVGKELKNWCGIKLKQHKLNLLNPNQARNQESLGLAHVELKF